MDVNVLVNLLASPNEALQSIEAKFKKSFDVAYYPSVCAIINDLASDGFTSSIGSQVEALVCVYLCHVMSSVYSDASGALALCLQQLDKNIREDARRLEQLKYRQTAKDFKKYARDAVDADGYRCRTAIKCFAFQCILGQVDTNSTPSKVLKQAQTVLDSMLESWSTTPGPLEDRLKELSSSDRSTLASNTIVTSATVPAVGPVFCRAAPLEAPLFAGEMHYLLGPESEWVFFDKKSHPKELSSLRRHAMAAMKQTLPEKERQELLNNSSHAHQIGLSASAISMIASHDPEVAATLLSKSSSPSSYIQKLLDDAEAGTLALGQLNKIVVSSGKFFDQTLAGKYIQVVAEKITKSNDADSAKEFTATLYQLVVKNKDFVLPENKKDALKKLFIAFESVQEISSLEADLLK